jgi:CheY-like chemotaxis protein
MFWFTVIFEKQPGEAAAERADTREMGVDHRKAALRDSESRPRAARILIAEDNITSQHVGAAILAKLGCRADVVANGKEALNSLQRIPYDLVLMDCQMPEMDGFEAAKRIRDAKSGVRNPNIPIVALTADAMRGDREQCLEAGMSDYIAKPVEPSELAAMLEKWLARDAAGSDSVLSQPSAAVFDETALLARLMGDRILARTIIDGFLEDMPKQFAALQLQIEQRDIGAARRQAHSIQSAAATVGACALHNAALRMEEAGGAGNLREMAARLSGLERNFQIAGEAMQSMKNGMRTE